MCQMNQFFPLQGKPYLLLHFSDTPFFGVLAGLCVDLAEERKQMAKTESDMPLVEAMENE